MKIVVKQYLYLTVNYSRPKLHNVNPVLFIVASYEPGWTLHMGYDITSNNFKMKMSTHPEHSYPNIYQE